MTRNHKSKEITKVGGATPDWLAAYVDTDTSKAEMQEHRVLGRIKVVQAMSSETLKEKFGEGAVIVTPAQVLIAEKRGGFRFVPVFFYAEYLTWSDREDQGSDSILARSNDKSGAIAIKAKNPDTREEVYGDGKYKMRHSEHLNFCGFIYGEHPYTGTPVVLSFARGEHRVGSQMVGATFMSSAPLWAQVFSISCVFRDQGAKKWWGLDVDASGHIQEDEAEFFESQHKELKELMLQGRLSTEHDDEEVATPPTDDM